jgi:hypothetical protein
LNRTRAGRVGGANLMRVRDFKASGDNSKLSFPYSNRHEDNIYIIIKLIVFISRSDPQLEAMTKELKELRSKFALMEEDLKKQEK